MSESWLNLEGKTVIVTGGASGIGKAVAQGFLNAGSNVVISDMAPEAPEMDEAAGKLLYVKTDVTKVADVEAMVEKAKETFGTIDVLVNNAGITNDKLVMRMDASLTCLLKVVWKDLKDRAFTQQQRTL